MASIRAWYCPSGTSQQNWFSLFHSRRATFLPSFCHISASEKSPLEGRLLLVECDIFSRNSYVPGRNECHPIVTFTPSDTIFEEVVSPTKAFFKCFFWGIGQRTVLLSDQISPISVVFLRRFYQHGLLPLLAHRLMLQVGPHSLGR